MTAPRRGPRTRTTGVETRDVAVRRFQALVDDGGTLPVLCHRVTEGDSVAACAHAWGVPAGPLWAWVQEDPARWRAYLAAKQAWVHGLIDEIVGIADGDGEVPRDRLRIATRLKLAAAFAPEVFGRVPGGGGSQTVVQVVVDRGRPPRTREGSPVLGSPVDTPDAEG